MKFIALALAALPVAFSAGSFSYKPESDKAPGAWGSLDLGSGVNNQCGGSQQSGIDVPTGSCDVYEDYKYAAGSCTLDDIDFTINDHSIVAAYNTERNGCTVPRMNIPGKAVPYDVLQFHLHTGTDHAVDGRYFGSCMHLVHKEVGGSGLSVLGFFLEPTDADGIPKFSDLLAEWEKVPVNTQQACDAQAGLTTGNETGTAQQGGGRRAAEQDERRLPRSFNPYDLVPKDASMYQYQGSLTTPPCSEIVFWNVIDTPVSISVREFLRLTNLIIDWVNPETCEKASEAAASGFTGRPVQAINGRKIERVCPSSFSREDEESEDNGANPNTNSETDEDEDLDSSAFMASAMAAVAASISAAALL